MVRLCTRQDCINDTMFEIFKFLLENLINYEREERKRKRERGRHDF